MLLLRDSEPPSVEHIEYVSSLLGSAADQLSSFERLLQCLVEQLHALGMHRQSLSSGLAECREDQPRV